MFGDAAAGRGVLLLLLLAAFGWGAVHALSPGHGKAMVAAYLVGTRGTPRHAVALGAIVTVTHTAGVFALGGVTLALSAYVLPETLYPWLNLLSGVLVVGIGAAVLRSHLRRRRAAGGHGGPSAHGHDAPRPRHDHDATITPTPTTTSPRAQPRGGDSAPSTAPARPPPPRRRAHPQPPADAARLARRAGDGGRGRPDPLPVGARGAARRDRPGPGGAGHAADRRFQRGPGHDAHPARPRGRLGTRFVRRVRVPSGLVTALPAASAVVIVGVGCVLTARALPLVAG